MKVRTKLALQFTLLFAVLLLLVLTGIYLFTAKNRKQFFFEQLDNRAIIVAQFYLAKDNLSKENFAHVLKKYPESLSREVVRIYDSNLKARFIPEGRVKWSKGVLQDVIVNKTLHLDDGRKQTSAIYYPDNSGNFIIVVSAFDENGYKYMHELLVITSIFFVISLILTFILGTLFSKIALEPIMSIVNNLREIRASSLNLRLPVRKKSFDEIDILSLTINQSLESLEQSFESQKNFVAHASHELRTPITSILGEAEIALLKERSATEYKSTLREIIHEVDRLNNFINSLMELMQTNLDNKDSQHVRMDELLWEICDELDLKNDKPNIKVDYDLPPNVNSYTIFGNRHLLFIAVKNVLKNALKFSSNKKVTCSICCVEDNIHLLIKDRGIGIPPGEIDNVFKPFYRGTNSEFFDGSGIGLSLTQNIVKLHSGKIEVESRLGEGTTFHLLFPITGRSE